MSAKAPHKRLLERTNAGHYFSECRCGWSGGVHPDRYTANVAWEAHRDGLNPVAPVPTIVLFGPRAHGQEATR